MRVPSRLVLASIVHTTIIISLMWQMTDSAGSSDKQSVNNDITISQQRINLNDDNTFYCRSRSNSLSMAAFRLETCYLCYYYMPQNQFIHGAKWTATSNDDFRVDGFRVPRLTDNNGTKVLADIEDEAMPLRGSFLHPLAERRWQDCCRAAEDCCQKIKVDKINVEHPGFLGDITGSRCPPTWDGWQCWSSGGSAGTVAHEPCPSYIYFHSSAEGELQQDSCGRYAEKNCTASGVWFWTTQRGEWTDYTTCSAINEHLTKEYIHVSLYVISIMALVPALTIFFAYKVLRVPRIAIHKNLFLSLLLHCIIMIMFKCIVLLPYLDSGKQPSGLLLQENTVGCRFLLMLSKYFRLTNYTWMFCEGYYLHHLLAHTFEEERSLKVILAIGWGLPLMPCIIYSIIRIYFDNELCWALPSEMHDWVEWIYMGPGLLCILTNFCFFINIFRILVTKWQAPHANEPAHFRKAVHATVILLPAFGLHWLLTLYRPQPGADCIWRTFYKYLNVLLDGLQGLMVSIAFCYRNGEIRMLLKQTQKRLREHFGRDTRSTTNHIPMKRLARRNSETYITQVGYSTVSSRHGSRYSLVSDSPTPKRKLSSVLMTPSVKHVDKISIEVRKANVSSQSMDSV